PLVISSCPSCACTHLVNVVEHAARYANDKNPELPPRPVLDAARHIHDHALVKLDLRVIQGHMSLSTEDVIKLIRPLVVVELGRGDRQVMHFAGGKITLLDKRPDQAASLRPRLHVGHFTADTWRGWSQSVPRQIVTTGAIMQISPEGESNSMSK